MSYLDSKKIIKLYLKIRKIEGRKYGKVIEGSHKRIKETRH